MPEIVDVRFREEDVPFRFSFHHGLAKRRSNKVIVVEITTADGVIGYGEILPRAYVTGETLETCRNSLQNFWCKDLVGYRLNFSKQSLFEIENDLFELFQVSQQRRDIAVYSGIDMALNHIKIKTLKLKPKVLGFREHSHGTLAVGLNMPLDLIDAVRLLKFNSFKLKISSDLNSERIARFAQKTKSAASRWLDANGTLQQEHFADLVKVMKANGLSKIEQPFAPGLEENWIRLHRDFGVTIMADEDVCYVTDAERLVHENLVQAFNLRIGKNGGLTGVLFLHRFAQERGIDVHMGALVGQCGFADYYQKALAVTLGVSSYDESFSPILVRRRWDFFNLLLNRATCPA